MGSVLPGKNCDRNDIWVATSSMLGLTLMSLFQHLVISVSSTGGQPWMKDVDLTQTRNEKRIELYTASICWRDK